MDGSIEITYYPRGFKKQKHGKDKYFNGIVIGQGRPIPALKKALKVLEAVNTKIEELDEAAAQDIKKFLGL